MALWLWESAMFLADTWRLMDNEEIEEDLPVVARPYAHGEWLDRFILGFENLAARIGSGHGGTNCLARCTAEELALHMIIATAEALAADDLIDLEWLSDCPTTVPKEDFDLMRDVLFEDHDVLMLYDPALDGIEDGCGGTGFLHPRDWFRPFRAE